MIIGVVLIVFGLVFLLQSLGIVAYNVWSIFWPVVVIAIGIKFLMKKGGHGHHHWCCGWHEKEEEKSK